MSRREEVLRESFARLGDDRVGSVEDRLRRAIVLLQRDHPRRRSKAERKIEDVAHGRGAEGVYRLSIITDDGEAGAVGLQAKEDLRLKRIRVLVLVDEDVVEAPANAGSEASVAHEVIPIEQ